MALSLTMGLLLILVGLWQAPDVCTRDTFLGPMITIGILLIVISILGCCGREHEGVHACYLVAMFVLILALLGFVIFGFVAAGGVDLGQLTVHTYKLEDYGGWLRGRVDDPRYWATTSACLRDRDVCKGVRKPPATTAGGMLYQGPANEHLRQIDWHLVSPIEAGCCMPPRSCGFTTYANGTALAQTPAVLTNADCSRWSNDQQTLCFQCDSCKAVLLDDTKKEWTAFAKIPVVIFITLVSRFPRV